MPDNADYFQIMLLNNYSINNGYNQYCEDIKRFNSKKELLGFVIGYNEAMNNY